MSGAGTLYLVPTTLGASEVAAAIPAAVQQRIRAIGYFIAEEPKRARAFLKALGHPVPLAAIRIEKLDPSSSGERLDELLAPLLEGDDAGVVADAGAPAVADPGASLVRRAHALNIRVNPLVGPSAILLALMASGLEGQRFAFCGYLPREGRARAERIRTLERRSRAERETQIFIETPYRSDALLEALLESCEGASRLCVAADLTLPSETIRSERPRDRRLAPAGCGRQLIPRTT